MAKHTSSRSGRRRVRLRATAPLEHSARPASPPEPVLGWIPSAIGGALLAAIASWIIVAGLSVVGWLPGETAELGDVLGLGTQFWLLGHGDAVTVAGARWTLAPLGITVLAWVVVRAVAAFAGRQALLGALLAGEDPGWTERARMVGSVGGVLAGTYLLVPLVVAGVVGTVDLRLVGGTALLAVTATAVGMCQGVQLDVVGLLPVWARPVPRAILASLLVIGAGAAAALAATMVRNLDRTAALAAELGAGPTGTAALTALQLAFLPTLLVWTASWVLGPGFSVGVGTLVSPADTQLGLLPAVPVSGALPPEGPGVTADFAWLAVGVLAGAMAAVMVMRARPRARFDETALVGGLAGTLAGLVFPLVALVATGDLGSNRLTGLGPNVIELVVVAPALLGLSGMAVGLGWGLVRRPARTGARA